MLPSELWVAVGKHLPLLDLASLASACRVLHKHLMNAVFVRRRKHYKYWKVVARECAPSVEGNNSIGEALELILRREIHPSMIRIVQCEPTPSFRRSEHYDWGASIARLEGGVTLQRLVISTSWVKENEQDEFMQAIASCDEEAALCLLLPLLRRLHTLRTFAYGPRTHAFVKRLAMARRISVLPSLGLVWAVPVNGEQGISLDNPAGR